MINRQTEETASLYVLDLLEEEDRDRFEAAMRESAELQQFVYELAAGLYDPVKKSGAVSRPDLLDAIVKRTTGISSESHSVSGMSRVQSMPVPWTYIWAAAAVILLSLNLMLLFILKDRASVRADELLSAGNPDLEAVSGQISEELALDPGERAVLEARIARLEQALESNEETVGLFQLELERAEGEAAEIRGYNMEWQQEYARLAARILPFFEPNDGLGRFTVIEMVDSEVFANDLPRRGFADLAGRYLTGDGNIAGVGTDEFIGPVVEGAGVLSANPDPSQAGLAPIARGSSATIADNSPAPAEVAGPQSGPVIDEEGRPTGFTVWRDDEQKGFLDLYNLPEVADGQEAYLWVRSSELDPYVPVGVVPKLENGTGSLFYSVDEPNFTPTEILVTAEESGAAGAQPGNNVILRGP